MMRNKIASAIIPDITFTIQSIGIRSINMTVPRGKL